MNLDSERTNSMEEDMGTDLSDSALIGGAIEQYYRDCEANGTVPAQPSQGDCEAHDDSVILRWSRDPNENEDQLADHFDETTYSWWEGESGLEFEAVAS